MDNELRFWTDDRGVQTPILASIFSSVIWLLYFFFGKSVYYSKYLSLLLSIFNYYDE